MNHEHHLNKEVYTCPMHPSVRQEAPGICPECGMNLVKTKSVPKEKHQHDKHEGHSTNIFKQKFWVSLLLTIPIIIYSPLPQLFFDFHPPDFTGANLLPFILGSIIFFYGGSIFLTSAYRELKGRAPGMMTLISLAIVTAYFYSVWQVLRGEEETLFWELSTLIVVMLLGHWIEMRAVQGARGALKELSALLPDTAEVIKDGETKTISLEELQVGDIVRVRPGSKIPADGIIKEGFSDIDESFVTGEAKPVDKDKGDEVVAGTINGDGSLQVEVTKIGEDTFLAGVKRLVADAQVSKSKLQLLSDRAAFYLTVLAVTAGILTLIAWLVIAADPNFAVERMVAVLVIACPHALGLAIPLVAAISTSMAAKNGFLVRDRLALESARHVNMVAFDKTGTLTEGTYGVDRIWSVNTKDEQEALYLAASVDAPAEHFIAKAMVKKAQDEKISLSDVTEFSAIKGQGVRGTVDGRALKLGGRALLNESGASVPDSLQEAVREENAVGKTIIYLLEDDKLLSIFAFSDVIREESRQAISLLKKAGVKIAMITGDSAKVAAWVSKELNIDEYFAEVLPGDKSEKVKELQGEGYKVAFVGDGINDAPALTQADIGVAIGAGTNVAIEAAGIVLVKNDPRDVYKIINLSKFTYYKMIQNLFWATAYNIIALPLAAGVAVYWGVVLNPAVAAVFMSLSTVIVAINAVLLRRRKLSEA